MWSNANVKSDVRVKFLKSAFTRSPLHFLLFFKWLRSEEKREVIHRGIHLLDEKSAVFYAAPFTIYLILCTHYKTRQSL